MALGAFGERPAAGELLCRRIAIHHDLLGFVLTSTDGTLRYAGFQWPGTLRVGLFHAQLMGEATGLTGPAPEASTDVGRFALVFGAMDVAVMHRELEAEARRSTRHRPIAPTGDVGPSAYAIPMAMWSRSTAAVGHPGAVTTEERFTIPPNRLFLRATRGRLEVPHEGKSRTL